MTIIPVTGPTPYQVHIGRGLGADIATFATSRGYSRLALIHQPSITSFAQVLKTRLDDAGLNVVTIEIPDAEKAKTTATLASCWDQLAAAGMTRRDAVIGLGGGAATDVAGFVAATWMRGIDVIQVPTTVLAMVDAAVGGKTGINIPAGKNMVGAFHEPAAVFIDIDYADSLPAEEIVAGSAEIVKTGFIADPEIVAAYEQDPASCRDPHGRLEELVAASVRVKARVVSEDLKESGLREILNYGHTFGHAIERVENYQWRHGNAVAVGMVYEATLAALAGHGTKDLVARHRAVLEAVGLPTSYQPGRFDELVAGMRHDKKNRSGRVRFVVLDDIAAPTRLELDDSAASLELMRAAYEEISRG